MDPLIDFHTARVLPAREEVLFICMRDLSSQHFAAATGVIIFTAIATIPLFVNSVGEDSDTMPAGSGGCNPGERYDQNLKYPEKNAQTGKIGLIGLHCWDITNGYKIEGECAAADRCNYNNPQGLPTPARAAVSNPSPPQSSSARVLNESNPPTGREQSDDYWYNYGGGAYNYNTPELQGSLSSGQGNVFNESTWQYELAPSSPGNEPTPPFSEKPFSENKNDSYGVPPEYTPRNWETFYFDKNGNLTQSYSGSSEDGIVATARPRDIRDDTSQPEYFPSLETFSYSSKQDSTPGPSDAISNFLRDIGSWLYNWIFR